MREMFLSIIQLRFICTEIRTNIKNTQTLGAALKKIVIAFVIILANKMEFTAIMIQQKINQPMQYWREKIKNLRRDQNGRKWLS